jgi:hypothetical protein
MTRFITDRLEDRITHLADFSFSHGCNTVSNDINGMCSESQPMAQHPYGISLVYVQSFCIHKFHTSLYGLWLAGLR